jgi:aminoglycoside 6'-N-acetyltransferase I
VEIRSVTAADADEWLRMRHELWPNGSLAEHRQDIDRYFAGDRREPAEVLVAFTAKGAPVGFAELSIRNVVDSCSTDHVAYLEGWYVVADARCQGIGRALFRAAERWAADQGCTEFGSDTLIDDIVSQAAHLGVGFEETGRVRTFRKNILPKTTMAASPGPDMTKTISAPEQQRCIIRSSSDINDALVRGIERGGVVVTDEDLCPEFFDLRTGFAGELLQKFVNYRVRLAVVLPDPNVYGERFRELVSEHVTHGNVRFFRLEEDARLWLKS